MAKKAFIVRMFSSGVDRLPQGLQDDRITIGWSAARGLIAAADQQVIRRILQDTYRDDNRRAGRHAGSVWRFLHVMSEGDLAIVPRPGKFYVAEVAGPAGFDDARVSTDTAYFRRVGWLNAKKPFSRTCARSDLQHKMGAGSRGLACADATYVLPLIDEVIRDFGGEQTNAEADEQPLGLFFGDLVRRLAANALKELLEGKMGERDFEKFLKKLFERLQGEVALRDRRVDRGADLVVEMPLGRSFLTQRVAIQAKYYRPSRLVGREAVEQLLTGMEAEDADIGLVITTSDFSQNARDYVESDECDKRVELIDGNYLARIVVEQGWRK